VALNDQHSSENLSKKLRTDYVIIRWREIAAKPVPEIVKEGKKEQSTH